MSKLDVIEGIQEMTSDERIPYSVDFAPTGISTLSSATVKAYDETDGVDVTSTVYPTATVTVSGAVATLPLLRSLTKGHTYRIEVLGIESTTYKEVFFRVKCTI